MSVSGPVFVFEWHHTHTQQLGQEEVNTHPRDAAVWVQARQ